MAQMGAAQSTTSFQQDAGQLSLRIVTDPPDRVETPALAKPRIAVHLGRSVYMVCQRAGVKHRGWGVHGDIDIIPAGTPAIWEPRQPDTALIVGIAPDLLLAAAEDHELRTDRLEVIDRFQIRDTQIEHICWALKAEMEAGYPTGRAFLDGLGTALAAAVVSRHSSLANAHTPVHASMSGHRLRQALSYIEDNLNRDLSLSEIAQYAGVSVSHLKTTFRQTTGVPVHRFIIQRRLERARTLLLQGKLSIGEIARETGFAHQSHLANHMRRLWGCSPKDVGSRNLKTR
jgi:AraC family transcriptional regulator